MIKRTSSRKIYAWFDISNHLLSERSWTRQYIELDRRERQLTFHSNECIRSLNDERKEEEVPIHDMNSQVISLSSLHMSNNEHSTVHIPRSNCILQSLSEYISPSLTKSILLSKTTTEEKSFSLTPLNHRSSDLSPLLNDQENDDKNAFSDRPSSITTPRQSKIKFAHFFGRSSTPQKPQQVETSLLSSKNKNNSLKRTKSVTKLERQRLNQQPLTSTHHQSSDLHISSNRSRSHESLFVSNGPLGSILPAKPVQIILENCEVRRLHSSLLPSSDDHSSSYQYVQIRNSKDNQNCYLRSKEYLTENTLFFNHLRHTSREKTNDALRIDNSLDIWILEAKGLPPKKKYYVKISLDNVIYGKSTSKERRDILFWGENFLFKDLPEDCSTLNCQIYRETERRKQKANNNHDIDLIGSVDIPLSSITGNQFLEQWYSLQIPTGKEKSQKVIDGSFNIRIKAKYQAIEILPIHSYSHLQEYIHRNYLRLIGILESHINIRDKDEIATSLTRIAQSLSFSTSFLVDIIQAEIISTPDNTLTFRGNSIATKSMESYMKFIGERYLRDTLRGFVSDIVSSKNVNDIDVEVDPDRVGNIENLEKNRMILRFFCEKIWSEIQQSHCLFPPELKLIFFKLRQLSSSDETMFNLISGSVFLRFLCPAILSPNLFGLTQEYPSEKASRKLTLIAKTLQTLANFSKFGPKESYMKFMNDFVRKESDNMRRFLANISTIDNEYPDGLLIDQDIKYDIDLGREYAILHTTLTNLFEQLDLNLRQSLNELEYLLNQLTNMKIFYFSSKVNTQIHHHHYHHHHIHHHSSSNDSQMSLSLNGTGTTNESSQGYHSISTSSTVTNIDHIHPPLSFTNPLYHQRENKQIRNDLSENDPTKRVVFLNNLSLQSLKDPSSTRQSPLDVFNQSSIQRNTQSLASSSIDPSLTIPNSSGKLDDDLNETPRREEIFSSQQFPPKMGLKALHHSSRNKDPNNSPCSPIINLYHEEKCRRIESEEQTERFRVEILRLNEQLEEYRHVIELINKRTNDYSKEIEKKNSLDENPENQFSFIYRKSTTEKNHFSISSHLTNEQSSLLLD